MFRHSVAFAVVAFGLSRDPGGCGGTDSPEGGLNAPCTRSKDCSDKLVCADGVCIDPNADASPRDSGGDATVTPGDASNDGG